MRLTKAALATYVLPQGKAEALIFDQDMPGFGLRVRAGGKRTWIAQYRLGTKQRRVTLGSVEVLDPDEARKRAREALAKVSLGGDPQSDKRMAKEQAAVTFGSVLPRYLAYAARRHKAQYLADTRRYLERNLAPLGQLALHQITRSTISARLADVAENNGLVAANRARAALSAFYAWAMGEGVAAANPVIGTHKATDEVRRDRVLSDDELRLVWLRAGAGDFGVIVRLLILTGQRREEVCGMCWSEVQPEVWRIGAHRSKNGRPHEVPLSAQALSVLAEKPQRLGRDLVFGSAAGPFQGWSSAKTKLDKEVLGGLRAVGGPKAILPAWRIHDIRRTVATGMANLGVLPHVVEAVLNHVSGHRAGVAGIYNRATYTTEKKAALELWGAHVDRLVSA